MKKILILGAGFAGLTLATSLGALAKEGKAEVLLIDKSASFSMGFSMQWVMMGRRRPEDGERSYSLLKAKNVKFIQDEVVSIDKDKSIVRTKFHSFEYDYLVIALGAELSPELVPGLAENGHNLCDLQSVIRLKKDLEKINEGTIVVMISSTPFKCPPAPYEYALLIDDILRERKVRDEIRIIMTTPESQPMLVAGEVVGDAVKAMLAQKGIEYMPQHKPKTVDTHRIIYENGLEIKYDLLCAMPPHRAPKVARDSGITDSSGFIPVELGSFVTSIPNVYAVGDVASIKLPNGNPHPKAGVFAEVQAETVAKIIEAEITGIKPDEYTGSGVCFIDVGDNKAAPAEINLLTPEGPKAMLYPPTTEGLERKKMFEADRFQRWFGG